MKRITAGILAHVDAGKTTLSEGLLYLSGEIKKLGRVDTGDAFLDTNEIERQRGITIFSHQASITLGQTLITLLDTPGHVDFVAEAERTLSVLDYAILVISGSEGVQSHTRSIWDMLKKHNIPVFVFINKMDLENSNKERVMEEMKNELGGNFIDFMQEKESLKENLAMCDEKLIEEFLVSGDIDEETLSMAIKERNVFPCFCGSALKMNGVEDFLNLFDRLIREPVFMEDFGAKVFKIGQDDKGNRLTFMKITGGSLKVKSMVETFGSVCEKVNEIRIYSGEKYKTCDEALPGCVCAVTGLKKTKAGQGLGFEKNADSLTTEPIFSYKVILPKGTDTSLALEMFKQIEQEETQLKVTWNETLREIQLRLMGEIQLEVLKQIIKKRFDIEVGFSEGGIVYKETIANSVEGVGHFEPLRHYAEVHLLLSPLERGQGMQFESDCPESVLDKSWQKLICTHLMEKQHIGVLTGSPVTDIKITLKSGAAHQKHTEGGDFRQATYRAVRHGLMCAKSILLEPYYDFSIEIPIQNVGRAMTDLDVCGAEFSVSHPNGDMTKITGNAPANAIRDYHKQITEYTHGRGRMICKFIGYGECKTQDEVISYLGYDADRDMENTADSVFCARGAGFNVKWNEVKNYMHLESILKPERKEEKEKTVFRSGNIHATEEELLKIFENTYGKVERRLPFDTMRTKKEPKETKYMHKAGKRHEKDYLLIDGYNIIFAWDNLKKIAEDSLEDARYRLIEEMSVYKVFKDCEIIIVFDAYKVKGNREKVENLNDITIVYTKESQTADSYIERCSKELTKNYNVTVATSDRTEQLIIFGSGAYRMPASHLKDELLNVKKGVNLIIKKYNMETENSDFLKVLKDRLNEWKNENM